MLTYIQTYIHTNIHAHTYAHTCMHSYVTFIIIYLFYFKTIYRPILLYYKAVDWPIFLLFYQTVFNYRAYYTRLNFIYIIRLSLYFIIGLLHDHMHCKTIGYIFYYNLIIKRIYFILLKEYILFY